MLKNHHPDFETKNSQILEVEGDSQNPLVQKMINRLSRAISEADLRRQMDMEDELERVLKREIDKEMEEERKKAEAERKKADAERKKAEAERQKAEKATQEAEAERQKNAQLLQQIEELKKLLNKND